MASHSDVVAGLASGKQTHLEVVADANVQNGGLGVNTDCKSGLDVEHLIEIIVHALEQKKIPFAVVRPSDDVAEVRAALDKLRNHRSVPPLTN